jgi:insulysin
MRVPKLWRSRCNSPRLSNVDTSIYWASRRVVLSTLLGAAATLPALPMEAAVGSGKAFEVFAVESAALDPRSHRALVLANGLRVLLTSYPKAAKGAASVTVQVGYMSDPQQLPGLAHFCEHMLFLGTRKFPNEGDFEKIVSAAGGSNNAYTAAEETNYFFDVQGGSLAPALERFAVRAPSATRLSVSSRAPC